MRKNSGDRGFSAAVQHRKASEELQCVQSVASGDFDNVRAEKLHANLRNGRSPVTLSKRQRCSVYDTKPKKSEAIGSAGGGSVMSAMSFVSVAVTVAGSLFVVSYAVVLTAIVNANNQ